MSNFHTLTDAFAELERRADAATAHRPADPIRATPVRHRSRLPLVAASVLAVSAVSTVAVGAALLVRHPAARSEAGGGLTTPAANTSTVPAAFEIPKTPAELARRFRTVLGDTATFTVTDTGAPARVTVPGAPAAASASGKSTGPALPAGSSLPPAEPNGAYIAGTLTAAGITGAFDLQIFRATAAERAARRADGASLAWCDDPDRNQCTVRRLADGGSLAVGHERLPGAPNAVSFQVDLVRPDGVEFLMHVSNERNSKGASDVLAPHPPLTIHRMTAIVTSDRW